MKIYLLTCGFSLIKYANFCQLEKNKMKLPLILNSFQLYPCLSFPSFGVPLLPYFILSIYSSVHAYFTFFWILSSVLPEITLAKVNSVLPDPVGIFHFFYLISHSFAALHIFNHSLKMLALCPIIPTSSVSNL